ncbi:MAG: hypothetical protein JW809_04735 [Pirellulales bacterium]|nr:hypothetical protein [Pirellulales bacterium]
MALVLVGFVVCAGQAEESMRVRIAWGGNTARIWQGTVSTNQGQLSEVRPLGIEADEPGSMWIDAGQVRIRQPSGRLYDGLDLLVTGPVASTTLRVALAPRETPGEPTLVEIPLANIVTESINAELDKHGTRLLARRSPGDALRVRFDRSSLVFSPGETFGIEVAPSLLPRARTGQLDLRVSLVAARGGQVAWEQAPIPLDDPPKAVPVEVPLGVSEGAYDVVLTVAQTPGLRLPALVPPKVVAQRKVQVLVLATNAPDEAPSAPTLNVVEQIDPANERWWERYAKPVPLTLPRLERLQLTNLQRFWKGPLGSGHAEAQDHALGRLTKLAPGKSPGEVSWEAYTLPIKAPGRPHVLEVEYPSDVPQRLGISVMEPNAAGALMPTQLDSGVVVAEPWLDLPAAPPKMLRHRLIFWPRTKAPMVLMTNRGNGQPALYGKIRVLAGWEHLPRAFSKGEIPPERLLAAYLGRPLFPESFCASEAYDPPNRSLDDWVTFHEGGTRLVEYLHHVGLGGLMISVWADGATIYPSQVTQPTPRYDRGVFFATGQDPVQKDVLEMLFRLFDRHQLQLIPAVEFGTPLPELEAILRRGGAECEGLQWVGPDGVAWRGVHLPQQRLAPYYNVLDARVQEAMLRVAGELIEQYAPRHESFAGLAIQLSGNGYAVLPGPQWGLDDATVGRFERETGIRVPAGTGPDRFVQRAEFLLRDRRAEWLAWRAATLGRFYDRLQTELSARRKGARVFLATEDLTAGPLWPERLRPALAQRPAIRETLLEVGIDTARYDRPEGPVLLHPEHIQPLGPIGEKAVELEAAAMFDAAGRSRQWAAPGSLFSHAARETRLESFDRKSPYRESYTSLLTQWVPSDRQNRRRFVHSLALWDSTVLFDGGRLVPMGQEDSLRDLVAIYRHLPAVRFATLSDATQPVTVRYATCAGRTYVYAANDSPVPATLLLAVNGPPGCRVKNLADEEPPGQLERRADGLYWKVELAPYDLAAMWLSAPDVRIANPRIELPQDVPSALAARIQQLGVRAATLRAPPALKAVANADFEQASADPRCIAAWNVHAAGDGAADAQREATPPAAEPGKPPGKWSVRLTSSGPPVALVSQPFDAPSTGRLSLFVWLRVPDSSQQPAVELVLTGRWRQGELPTRTAILGRSPDGQMAPPITAPWRPFVFQVHDLPLEGLSDLRVAVRLAGPGEVWVDDVQLHHLEFEEDELKEFSRIISAADATLRTRSVGDCIRLLDGYWPRFLETYVPLSASVAARARPDSPGRHKPADAAPTSPTVFDRMKDLVPRKLW